MAVLSNLPLRFHVAMLGRIGDFALISCRMEPVYYLQKQLILNTAFIFSQSRKLTSGIVTN